MSDEEEVKAANEKFDLILSTIPYQHDINPYWSMAAHDGTLHFLGLFMPVEQLAMMPLLLNRKSIIGSLISGVAETQKVLDFCA